MKDQKTSSSTIKGCQNNNITKGASDIVNVTIPTSVVDSSFRLFSINFKELWEYRDLLYFMVWRNIKAVYAQSILGIGWVFIKPVITMIVFTVIFGKLAKISSDGVPYAIFNYTALVPWTYFSSSLVGVSNSLVATPGMLTQVYFPRLILPMTPVLTKFVDFFVAVLILLVLMAWFRIVPTALILFLPLLIIPMMLTTLGIGMWFTSLAVQYRDFRNIISFIVQLLMYASPVVYPASLIPEQYRLLYGINPMVGVIEGFRSALLSTNPMPWDLILVGSISSVVFAISGLLFFRKRELIFADVI